jgi:hypothetical protein
MPLGSVPNARKHSASITTLSTGTIVLVHASPESIAIDPFPKCSAADATTKLGLFVYLRSNGKSSVVEDVDLSTRTSTNRKVGGGLLGSELSLS